jgi:hypothetical protein
MLACIAGGTTPGAPNLVFGHQRFGFSVLNSVRESRKEAAAARLDTITQSIILLPRTHKAHISNLQFCSFAVF